MATNPANDHRIDYIELPAANVGATKQFYVSAFGWRFTDYGPDYSGRRFHFTDPSGNELAVWK